MIKGMQSWERGKERGGGKKDGWKESKDIKIDERDENRWTHKPHGRERGEQGLSGGRNG